jgi:hypothetical protein
LYQRIKRKDFGERDIFATAGDIPNQRSEHFDDRLKLTIPITRAH